MQNQTTTLQDALDTRFFAPLRRPRTRRVGVELEFPVWNRTPLMICRDWPSFIDRKALAVQLHRILDIAEEGLARRGFGEEPLLAPLRRRAETLTSPAREHLARLVRGESVESIAEDYGSAEAGRHA